MSRIVRRSVTTAAISLLTCALVLAAGALAATPKKGARFSGHLSTAPVEGFTAPVKFKVAANGKQLEDFTYGSFGCFGAGGFRPGVNPYKGNSLVKLGALKVAGNGRFAQTKTAGYTVQGQTTSFTVSVSGHFTKHTRATGTIKFTESNSVTPSKCTSDTLTFTASS